MPRVVRSAAEQFALIEGVCRGYEAKLSVSAIARVVHASRDTVRRLARRFVADGRNLKEYLDAVRPPAIVDPKRERKRQQSRERQRKWQRRAKEITKAQGAVASKVVRQQGFTDDEYGFLLCANPLRKEAIRAHVCREMLRANALHTAWSIEAVISLWPPLTSWQEECFRDTGLRMADVLPAVLRSWGWLLDGDGFWVNPDLPNGRVIAHTDKETGASVDVELLRWMPRTSSASVGGN